ncbi:hypothetical protein LSHI6S_01068 [Leifsonia shinshuensis]
MAMSTVTASPAVRAPPASRSSRVPRVGCSTSRIMTAPRAARRSAGGAKGRGRCGDSVGGARSPRCAPADPNPPPPGSPVPQSAVRGSPVPTVAARTPPARESPARKSPAPMLVARTPPARTRTGKSPARTPAGKSPARTSSVRESPVRKSSARTPPARKAPAPKPAAGPPPVHTSPGGPDPRVFASPAGKLPVLDPPADRPPAHRPPAREPPAPEPPAPEPAPRRPTLPALPRSFPDLTESRDNRRPAEPSAANSRSPCIPPSDDSRETARSRGPRRTVSTACPRSSPPDTTSDASSASPVSRWSSTVHPSAAAILSACAITSTGLRLLCMPPVHRGESRVGRPSTDPWTTPTRSPPVEDLSRSRARTRLFVLSPFRMPL